LKTPLALLAKNSHERKPGRGLVESEYFELIAGSVKSHASDEIDFAPPQYSNNFGQTDTMKLNKI
jgi:hypothetical protein